MKVEHVAHHLRRLFITTFRPDPEPHAGMLLLSKRPDQGPWYIDTVQRAQKGMGLPGDNWSIFIKGQGTPLPDEELTLYRDLSSSSHGMPEQAIRELVGEAEEFQRQVCKGAQVPFELLFPNGMAKPQLKPLEVTVDPDKNLKRQLSMASHIVWAVEEGRELKPTDAQELAELVISLNEWIRRGGFLPAAWKPQP